MYTVYFKDERSGLELSCGFDGEIQARGFIQSLAEDIWQRFVRAEKPDGTALSAEAPTTVSP
jgi:hypothetical protein